MLLFVEPGLYMFDFATFKFLPVSQHVIINDTLKFDIYAENIFSRYIKDYDRRIGDYSPLQYIPINILSIYHVYLKEHSLKSIPVADILDNPDNFRFDVEFGRTYELCFNGDLVKFLEDYQEDSMHDGPSYATT